MRVVRSAVRALCLLVALDLSAACTGLIGAPGGTDVDRPDSGLDDDGGQVDPADLPPFAPAASGIRRLTVAQYRNSVSDLLGGGVEMRTEIEDDVALNGSIAIGTRRLTISPRGVEQYETAAFDAVQQVLSDPRRRADWVSCTPSATNTCAREFLRRFGRLAWRRRLTDNELNRYSAIATTAASTLNDPWKGLGYAVAGLLQSPNFLFRVEVGEPDPSTPGRRRYTGHEMATRLSFLLWNTTPDDALLDAADRGELSTEAGLRAHAERMLASPRARTAFGEFVSELMELDRLDTLSRSADDFALASPTLGASMKAEIQRRFDDLVFERDGDYRDLFTSAETFVNAELARIYGLTPPGGEGFVRVRLPGNGPRAGLLGAAGVLAAHSYETSTSATLRGRFIRQELLCQDVPSPPPGVDAVLPAEVDGKPTTARVRLAVHRTLPSCAGCHSLMDPIGLGLENFDPIGAYRATEFGQPIEPGGDLDGRAFRNARELGAVLRDAPQLGSCLVRRLYRYATANLEAPGEQVVLGALSASFRDAGFRVRRLITELVASDGFRFAADPR